MRRNPDKQKRRSSGALRDTGKVEPTVVCSRKRRAQGARHQRKTFAAVECGFMENTLPGLMDDVTTLQQKAAQRRLSGQAALGFSR